MTAANGTRSPFCTLLFRFLRARPLGRAICLVPYTGRIARYGGTSVIFIGCRDLHWIFEWDWNPFIFLSLSLSVATDTTLVFQ